MKKRKKNKSRTFLYCVLGFSVFAIGVIGIYYLNDRNLLPKMGISLEEVKNRETETDKNVEETKKPENTTGIQQNELPHETIPDDASILDTVRPDYCLRINLIDQNRSAPSGCEITALTTVLNYYSIPATNVELADNYLPRSTWNMYEGFVGDIYEPHGFGCYASVIAKTANSYIADKGYNAKAEDISGSEKAELIAYLEQGIPVIIWNTNLCKETQLRKYILDGHEVDWMTNEHCVVLGGYNSQTDKFAIVDSIYGYREFDASLFLDRYHSLFSQAVVIKVISD